MIHQSNTMTKNSPPRKHVSAVYMRGGSSKALFFHEQDVPGPGPQRDALLKRVMGSPDPLQIDGMGGTKAVTSKVAIIQPSARSDADVDYTFGQVGVADGTVGYKGNCGNISAGVGPFAIEEGLVEGFRKGQSIDEGIKAQEVRIYNTNTEKILIAHVPVGENGAPLEKGDFAMPAVPGTGAPILMDYVNTIGARLQSGALPTGNVTDSVQLGEKEVSITFCDVGNPIVFVNAEDLGMTARESAEQITSDTALVARADELRGRAAQLVGMCEDWEKVDEQSPFLPMVVAIAPAQKDDEHINARLFLDHMCHESMAGSGAICTTACSRIPGTLVNKVLNKDALEDNTFRISHPVGVMPVFVKTKQDPQTAEGIPDFETLSFVRTARRIMEGRLLIPE